MTAELRDRRFCKIIEMLKNKRSKRANQDFNYNGHIDIFYGLSYGSRVLMEVLADNRLTVTTTIADGISLKDYPDIKSKIGKDVYCFFSRVIRSNIKYLPNSDMVAWQVNIQNSF